MWQITKTLPLLGEKEYLDLTVAEQTDRRINRTNAMFVGEGEPENLEQPCSMEAEENMEIGKKGGYLHFFKSARTGRVKERELKPKPEGNEPDMYHSDSCPEVWSNTWIRVNKEGILLSTIASAPPDKLTLIDMTGWNVVIKRRWMAKNISGWLAHGKIVKITNWDEAHGAAFITLPDGLPDLMITKADLRNEGRKLLEDKIQDCTIFAKLADGINGKALGTDAYIIRKDKENVTRFRLGWYGQDEEARECKDVKKASIGRKKNVWLQYDSFVPTDDLLRLSRTCAMLRQSLMVTQAAAMVYMPHDKWDVLDRISKEALKEITLSQRAARELRNMQTEKYVQEMKMFKENAADEVWKLRDEVFGKDSDSPQCEKTIDNCILSMRKEKLGVYKES